MAVKPRPVLTQPEGKAIRLIALTQGQVAIVDADRYAWASQWHWYATWNPCTRIFCAVRNGREGEPHTVRLHRQLLGEPEGLVDHWNGNSLDCRIANLRVCTPTQNNANSGPGANNTSGCPGVDWVNRKWRARINVEHKTIHLGCFANKEDAIKARQVAERQYFGDFAYSARQPYQHEAA
jgi:hypothetical protein